MQMSKLKYVKLSSEAIRAIFDNRKRQMRFALKCQDMSEDMLSDILANTIDSHRSQSGSKSVVKLPYVIGDTIGVKETWTILDGKYVYRADDEMPEGWHLTAWRPSTRMPKDAVRLYLKVTDIRIERLQDISRSDISDEGVWLPGTLLPQAEFSGGWDQSMSKKKRERYGWDQNPWVVVVIFERQMAYDTGF